MHRGTTDRYSIPFFFEASWDAYIEPLFAAVRLQEARLKPGEPLPRKQGIEYGQHLTRKVGGNFASDDRY